MEELVPHTRAAIATAPWKSQAPDQTAFAPKAPALTAGLAAHSSIPADADLLPASFYVWIDLLPGL